MRAKWTIQVFNLKISVQVKYNLPFCSKNLKLWLFKLSHEQSANEKKSRKIIYVFEIGIRWMFKAQLDSTMQPSER